MVRDSEIPALNFGRVVKYWEVYLVCWTRRIIVKDFFLTEVELTHHVSCKNTDWMTVCQIMRGTF